MQFTYFYYIYMDHSYHQKLYKYFKMQIWLSSLELIKGDMSTLIHQMKLIYVSYIVGMTYFI